MGRFSFLLMVLAACGDNLGGVEQVTPGEGRVHPGVQTIQAPAYVPAVCGAAQWSTTGGDAKLDLAMVSNGHGTTSIVTAPVAGGAMTGFAVDDRMTMIGDPSQTKLPLDGTFTAVTASVVGGRVLTASLDGGATRVHLFGEDLSSPQELGKLGGSVLAKPAFLVANHQRVVATGGAEGVSLTTLDANFNLGTTLLAAPTSEVDSLATAQYGDAIMAAWTTIDKHCYVADLAAFAAGTVSHVDDECARPRIATELATATTNIVFERDGTLRLMHVSHLHGGEASTLLRPNARAPRIAFDGLRFWVSYIDARGDIVVGFLDADQHLVSMGLVGPAPADDAYELTLVDGRMWVVSMDAANGFMAHQMCAVVAD
ncbi:MAG TPA: hypothetical protein VFQ65_14000 [Kofleriaceae bacterium]|nr:hypothetical protein [Kofleriaceae bacterium]